MLLIGDIGGTNARFALADAQRPAFTGVVKVRCDDFETAEAAIAHVLERIDGARPEVICLAVAGPVNNGSVSVTNNHWQLERASLAQRFGAGKVLLLNDFAAVACALPFLAEGDSVCLGPVAGKALQGKDFNVAVLGPGTGLGVAGLLGRRGALYPVVGEGGHRAFAPETARQIELLEALRRRFRRVSYERLLSGPGLENVYAALGALNDQPPLPRDAAGIFTAAGRHNDPLSDEAVALFFEILGQLAGDLALEMGAVDGVYIAGGIVQRYPGLLEGSDFRAAFERKGRHRALLEKIPTQLITHADPGLLGAAYCALRAASDEPAGQGS